MLKTVLITGASRGIGAATAKVFASHGYNIIVNYNKSKEQAKQLCQNLEKEYHIKAIFLKADISNQQEIDTMLEKIRNLNIEINCLVNNAGIDRDSLFQDKNFEDFETTLRTNLIGPFWLSKKIGKEMYERKQGKIINVTSTNAIDTYYPCSADYDASKAGLVSLTHNLAVQFAPYININAVAPGWTNTDMVKELDEEYRSEEEGKILLHRFAEPQEIANVIYFLATEEAKYINNEIIRVDGGWYL
ncbi:MAG: SDR family oxidoreductase [Bacilli bacterium]|jgi:3-oxoacyl-[acyl-carrier protein] reductase|nr:SDR family oxidoreductase [Bacilli bacterium]